MLYYELNLNADALKSLARSPQEIYIELMQLIPSNLDKRIVNNTVFFYFSKIATQPGLSLELAKEIKLEYMRNHQGALYGDLSEMISIPNFEGGQRIEVRVSDAATTRSFQSRGRKRRQTYSGV